MGWEFMTNVIGPFPCIVLSAQSWWEQRRITLTPHSGPTGGASLASPAPLQRRLTAHVPVPRVSVRVLVVGLHLDLDLGHGTGHAAAHGPRRRRGAGDLQVQRDAEEQQVTVMSAKGFSRWHGGRWAGEVGQKWLKKEEGSTAEQGR